MHLEKFFAVVHRELDKYARQCLCGDKDQMRKIHLISWDKVCKRKVIGGLGLEKEKEMNKAMLAKLNWRVLTEPNEVSGKLLREKYIRNHASIFQFEDNQGASQIWRGLN